MLWSRWRNQSSVHSLRQKWRWIYLRRRILWRIGSTWSQVHASPAACDVQGCGHEWRRKHWLLRIQENYERVTNISQLKTHLVIIRSDLSDQASVRFLRPSHVRRPPTHYLKRVDLRLRDCEHLFRYGPLHALCAGRWGQRAKVSDVVSDLREYLPMRFYTYLW